jgi:hypothetical protein
MVSFLLLKMGAGKSSPFSEWGYFNMYIQHTAENGSNPAETPQKKIPNILGSNNHPNTRASGIAPVLMG